MNRRDGDYYGGKVAGPLFATVASEALRYLGVPGTPVPTAMSTPAPTPVEARSTPPAAPTDFVGLGLAKALEVAREKHVAIDASGSGRVVAQEALADGTIRLRLSDER
jgi:hypothetical protein